MTQLDIPFKNKKQGGRKITQKDKIVEYMENIKSPIAIHEFGLAGVSQNSIGSRLPELAKEGKVFSIKNKNEPFKRWDLVRNRDGITTN